MFRSKSFKFIGTMFSICALLLVSLLMPGRAFGLTCASHESDPGEKIESSEYIFIGRVLSGELGERVDPALVQISKAYKGRLSGNVKVKMATEWEAYSITSGSEYLFLLDRYEPEKSTIYREACDYSSAY